MTTINASTTIANYILATGNAPIDVTLPDPYPLTVHVGCKKCWYGRHLWRICLLKCCSGNNRYLVFANRSDTFSVFSSISATLRMRSGILSKIIYYTIYHQNASHSTISCLWIEIGSIYTCEYWFPSRTKHVSARLHDLIRYILGHTCDLQKA